MKFNMGTNEIRLQKLENTSEFETLWINGTVE